MNSQQKTVNLLSICRKAGRLIIGFDAVKNAVTEGDVSCVLVSEDISHKTLRKLNISVEIQTLILSVLIWIPSICTPYSVRKL